MTQTNPTDSGILANVSGVAEKPVVRVRPGDRAIGRLTEIPLYFDPEGEAAKDLVADTFQQLVQRDPQAVGDVPAERQVNRRLMDMMADSNGWETARLSTAGNLPAAISAAGMMSAYLLTDEALKEALREQEEADRQEKEAQSKQAQADAFSQGAAAAGAGGDAASAADMQAIADALAAEAEAARGRAKQAAAKAAEEMDKIADSPYQQMRMKTATRDAAQRAKDVATAVAGWGFGPGSSIHTDPAQALEFLRQNQTVIQQIAKLAGRLRGVALDARRTNIPQGIVPNEVDLTRNLSRVLTTELALLRPDAHPLLRAEQAANWAENGLMGYTPEDDGEQRGTMVCAVDVSGSMGGARRVVAMAVALGIAQAAKADGRDYVLFTFGTAKDGIKMITSKDNWQAHLEWASQVYGGGTDFDYAIGEGIRLLPTLTRPDFLFVSDGEAGVADETVRAWKDYSGRTGARMFYVPVGYGGYVDIDNLADKVLPVHELDEQAGTDLAKKLGRLI